jgi:hypothetical protein
MVTCLGSTPPTSLQPSSWEEERRTTREERCSVQEKGGERSKRRQRREEQEDCEGVEHRARVNLLISWIFDRIVNMRYGAHVM